MALTEWKRLVFNELLSPRLGMDLRFKLRLNDNVRQCFASFSR